MSSGIAEDKRHILEGLLIALNNIDSVIVCIRKSQELKGGAIRADEKIQHQREAGERDTRDEAQQTHQHGS